MMDTRYELIRRKPGLELRAYNYLNAKKLSIADALPLDANIEYILEAMKTLDFAIDRAMTGESRDERPDAATELDSD